MLQLCVFVFLLVFLAAFAFGSIFFSDLYNFFSCVDFFLILFLF